MQKEIAYLPTDTMSIITFAYHKTETRWPPDQSRYFIVLFSGDTSAQTIISAPPNWIAVLPILPQRNISTILHKSQTNQIRRKEILASETRNRLIPVEDHEQSASGLTRTSLQTTVHKLVK